MCAAWSIATRSIVTVDGAKVFEGQLGGEEDIKAIDQQQASAVAAINGRFQNIPLKVTAGPHKVGVTFIARTFAESDEVLFSFRPGIGEERIPARGQRRDLRARSTPAGFSDTPSRQRIFVCRPKTASDELPCATMILSTIARRAFRRPVDRSRSRSAAGVLHRRPRASGTSTPASGTALPAILASPKFLYPRRATPPGTTRPALFTGSHLDLASRLSFFLLGHPPDDELLRLAREGRAGRSRRRSTRRCGGCWPIRESTSLVTNFAFQWLKMRGIDEHRAGRRRLSRTSTTACARRSARRSSCSSTASCARIAACSIC